MRTSDWHRARVRAPTPGQGMPPDRRAAAVPGTPVGRRRPRTAAAGANRGGRSTTRAAVAGCKRVAPQGGVRGRRPARQSLSPGASHAHAARAIAVADQSSARPSDARARRERGPVPNLPLDGCVAAVVEVVPDLDRGCQLAPGARGRGRHTSIARCGLTVLHRKVRRAVDTHLPGEAAHRRRSRPQVWVPARRAAVRTAV